jgi:queuine/archaeosine tRNA-ribosyltransferase
MYGVVHGGVHRDLRASSVDYLASLPFDGLAIGGALGKDRAEMVDMLQFLMPMVHEQTSARGTTQFMKGGEGLRTGWGERNPPDYPVG